MSDKIYNIKANQRLFERWQKTSAQCTSHISGMHIVQNDLTASSDQLNGLFHVLDAEIERAEHDFQTIILDLKRLRKETIDYIKEANK